MDNFTNPTANDSLNLPSHSTQHANANDAIEAIEGYLLNGGQGLTLVKKQTIGSAVSSVIVTNAFSATYQNYLISINDVQCSIANDSLAIQMRTGTTTSTSGYNYALIYSTYGGSINTAASGSYASFINTGRSLSINDKVSFSFNLFAPFLASKTLISTLGTIGSDLAGNGNGFHNSATSYDQFVLSASGTLTGGTIYVYGYGIGQ